MAMKGKKGFPVFHREGVFAESPCIQLSYAVLEAVPNPHRTACVKSVSKAFPRLGSVKLGGTTRTGIPAFVPTSVGRRSFYLSERGMAMTEQDIAQITEVVKNLLQTLHERRYEALSSCVDEMEWADTDEIGEIMDLNLEAKELDFFDEYGVPCHFHPAYEYHQMRIYEYTDNRGILVDYDMTGNGGEMADLVLQLKFQRRDSGLYSIFLCIDPA